MTYLLDTNVCIDYLRRRGTSAIRRAFARGVAASQIALSSIVLTELLAGCYGSRDPAKGFAEVNELRRLFRSLPFDDAAGEIAARVNAGLESKGERIGHNDLFIAGVALSQDLTLVTHNLREFGRVPGLRIQDWEATP